MIDYIKNKIKDPPMVGIVLGSGLEKLTTSLENKIRIPYKDIPSFIQTTVKGHVGEFVYGTVRGTSMPVICANGRFHYYEGLDYSSTHIIIDIFNDLGCKNVITTNSSGCLVQDWSPGELMIIDSHIDMTFRDGPDQINKKYGDSYYDSLMMGLAERCMNQAGIPVRKGTYGWTLGPTYETPAEVQFLQEYDISAVGMSTVPEIERAHELNLKLLSLACLTNYAVGISSHPLTHEEVVEQANKSGEAFTDLLSRILVQIDQV
jgi:purine-nucleoside phosphorylase|tara:strand:- start:513 stop:1298 length:786 start_codon:yes stop_codon:yes gene_type:complete